MTVPNVSIFQAQSSPEVMDHIRLIEDIEDGLNVEQIEQAATRLGITLKDLSQYGVIALRTLSHSRQNGKFSAAQSDRIVRFFRVLQAAVETFGETDKAQAWLKRPTRALEQRTPLELIHTDEGTRLVEQLLHRIDHGLGT